MESAGRVDNQDVKHPTLGFIQCIAGNIGWTFLGSGRKVVCADLLGKTLELQHGSRAAHVRADEQDTLALPLDQPACQFCGRSCLSGALQARQQHDDRRLRPQVDAGSGSAHQLYELAVQDADERLAGRQACGHLGADRLRLDGIDEGANHRQGHIGLQERYPHLPQGFADILLRDTSAAPEVVQGAREPGCQIVEHGKPLQPIRGTPRL